MCFIVKIVYGFFICIFAITTKYLIKNMTVMYISELNKKKKKIEQNSYIIREQHV